MDEHSLTRILQQQLRFSNKIKSADAAVLIAITNEDNPKVLLTRRSVYLSNHAGEESIECRLFEEDEIPWSELAFPSVEHTLRHYFADRKSNQFNLHLETLGTRLDHTG